MKNSKQQFSDIELEELSRVFKILSEPSRLKILRALFAGEKCVTDIINATGLLQANVSKQLKTLHTSNIVSCHQEGLQRFYSVQDPTILEICNVVCKSQKDK